MASDQACIIHFPSSKTETVSTLGYNKRTNIIAYAKQWTQFSKEPEKSIATALIANNVDSITDESLCHYTCYSRFTNKTRLTRAEDSFCRVSKIIIKL